MTARAVRGIVIAAGLLIAIPFRVSAQEITDGPIVVSNPILAASVQRLSAESASWREAVAAVAATGRRTILTTAEVGKNGVDADALAQAHPWPEDAARIDSVFVVINLELLQKLSGLSMKAIDFEDDLDRIVAHEVYGHAIPLLLAGTRAGHCADPAPGQSAIASCAVQRENVIRREMRLGQRFDYGRESLALAHRYQR